VKLTREKRIEEAEKRKEGQFYRDRMRGRLRDTIDGGAENTTGVTTRWNQGSKIIEDDSNDDDVASESVVGGLSEGREWVWLRLSFCGL